MNKLKKYFLILLPMLATYLTSYELVFCMQDQDITMMEACKNPTTSTTSKSSHRKKRERAEEELSSTNTSTEELDKKITKKRHLNEAENNAYIDRIYTKVCQKISIPNGQSILNDNIVDVQNASPLDSSLLFPNNQNVATQSLNHIRFLLENHHCFKNDNYPKILDEASVNKLIQKVLGYKSDAFNVIKNILKTEKDYQEKGYNVFYHAFPECVIFYQDLYHFLHSWGFLNKNQPLALRAFIKEEQPADIKAFLNLFKPDHTGKFVYYKDEDKYINGEYTYYFMNVRKRIDTNIPFTDHLKEVSNQCLSVNFSLFGNFTAPGETSLEHAGASVNERLIQTDRLSMILEDLFKQMNIPQKFVTDLINIYKKCGFKDNAHERLLQIFVKNDVVNDVAYLSFAGGTPLIDDTLINKKISEILKLYTSDPTQLNKLLTTYKLLDLFEKPDDDLKTEQTNLILNLDLIQARLWLPSKFLYDPNYTKIFRYNLQPTQSFNYKQEMAKVFENIIKDRIEKIKSVEIKHNTSITTPLSAFDEFVTYELDRDKYIKNELTKPGLEQLLNLLINQQENLNIIDDFILTIENTYSQKDPDEIEYILQKLLLSFNAPAKQKILALIFSILQKDIFDQFSEVAINVAQNALISPNPQTKILGMKILIQIIKMNFDDPYSLIPIIQEQCWDEDPAVVEFAQNFLKTWN
jgi:hypothetical protein